VSIPVKAVISALLMLIVCLGGVLLFIAAFGAGPHSMIFGLIWGALVGHFGARLMFAWFDGGPRYGIRF
jgi:hypothetical protein